MLSSTKWVLVQIPISSLELAVEFLDDSGGVVHLEDFFPLKGSAPARATTIAALSLFTSGRESPLLQNESFRFKHILSEQRDKDIISPIRHKKYATNPNEWSGKFNHRIRAIKF